MLGSNELMNSRLSGSEQALARLACDKIRGRRQAQVLIGGLGMGFTLRAALAELAGDARVTVAELVPAVVAWARGPMAETVRRLPRRSARQDPRGRCRRADTTGGGPLRCDPARRRQRAGGLSRQANDGLYDVAGLAAARAALRSGGVLAVWSSGPYAGFTRRMHQAGFDVDEVKIGPTAGAARGRSSGLPASSGGRQQLRVAAKWRRSDRGAFRRRAI